MGRNAAIKDTTSPHIRLANLDDASAILDIYRPYVEHTTFSFETEIPTVPIFQERMQKVLKKDPWLVCELDGLVIGYAYANDHRWRVAYQWTKELSVYVHDGYHRRGIATALYTALIELLKRQGYANTLIGITMPNPVSVAFHESMGYQLVGYYHNVGFKSEKFQDVGWWEMPIRDMSEAPPPIRSVWSLTEEELREALRIGEEQINWGNDVGN